MGESPSARTQRDLADLRARIDADLNQLRERAREDADPRRLASRNPIATAGTVGSVALLVAAKLVASVRAARARRSMTEVDKMLEKLGARADKLNGRARKRLRERLAAEMDEAQKGNRVQEAAWAAGISALTAGATELFRKFARRLADDSTDEHRGRVP